MTTSALSTRAGWELSLIRWPVSKWALETLPKQQWQRKHLAIHRENNAGLETLYICVITVLLYRCIPNGLVGVLMLPKGRPAYFVKKTLFNPAKHEVAGARQYFYLEQGLSVWHPCLAKYGNTWHPRIPALTLPSSASQKHPKNNHSTGETPDWRVGLRREKMLVRFGQGAVSAGLYCGVRVVFLRFKNWPSCIMQWISCSCPH